MSLDGRGWPQQGKSDFDLNKEQHSIKLPLSFQRAGRNRIPILLQNREKGSKLLQKWQVRNSKAGNRAQAPGRTHSAHGFAPRNLLQLWEQRGGTRGFQNENPKFKGFWNVCFALSSRKMCIFLREFSMVHVPWHNLSLWEFHVWNLPFPATPPLSCHWCHSSRRADYFLSLWCDWRPRVLIAASCLAAPLQLFPIYPPLCASPIKIQGDKEQRGDIVLKYPQTGQCFMQFPQSTSGNETSQIFQELSSCCWLQVHIPNQSQGDSEGHSQSPGCGINPIPEGLFTHPSSLLLLSVSPHVPSSVSPRFSCSGTFWLQQRPSKGSMF